MSKIMYMYRFSCKPNYPVIYRAFVIFQHSEVPSNRGNLLVIAKKLAKKNGIAYVEDNQELEYLGQFHACQDFQATVIHAESGEY